MEKGAAAWRLVSAQADRMRVLSQRLRGERAKVARLAALVLESLADKALSGALSWMDLERLDELTTLLRLYGLPLEPVERTRSVLSRLGPSPGRVHHLAEGIIALA